MKEIFNRAMASNHGKIVDTTSDKVFQALVNHWRPTVYGVISQSRYMGRKLSDDIYADFTDNWEINAVATVFERKDIVGIYSGLLVCLYDTFMTLLSDPRLLPDIGMPDEEQQSFSDLSSGLINREKILNYRPQSQYRISYALFLCNIAVQFILQHEVGHLVRGHLVFLNETSFSEMGSFRSKISSETLRILEFDADWWSFKLLIKFITDGSRIPYVNNGVTLCKTRKDLACANSFAITTLFQLLSEAEGLIHDEGKNTHPHPGIRWAHFLSTLGVALEENKISDQKDISDGAVKGFVDCAHVVKTLKLPGAGTHYWAIEIDKIDYYLDEYSNLLNSYLPKIHDCQEYRVSNLQK